MIRCGGAMPTFTAVTLFVAATAAADSVVIGASKDNTLYTDGTGRTSNGAGQYFFAGQSGSVRRAVLAFDIAASIPAGSTIQSVQLTLHCSRAPVGAPPVGCTLNRLLADWGEGTSDAGDPGGAGTASTPG